MDDKDPPVINPDSTVVDIGDLRVGRGYTRRPQSSCRHANMTYDRNERRIWCSDCETNVEPFDAFMLIVQNHDRARSNMEARKKELAEAETFQLRTLAAKEVDKAWRKRSMLPACPNCSAGLFPEDFKNGVMAMVGREYAEARRKRNGNR